MFTKARPRAYNRHGFSLIEFTIYFFLVLLLSTLVIHWVSSSHIRMSRVGNKCLQSLAVCAAADCLMRDLYTAPSDLEKWKLCDESAGYVFCAGSLDVGFACDEGSLVRSEGTYNTTAGAWSTRKKSVIARDVTACTLTRVFAEKSNQVRQLVLNIRSRKADHEYTAQHTITIRNGTV